MSKKFIQTHTHFLPSSPFLKPFVSRKSLIRSTMSTSIKPNLYIKDPAGQKYFDVIIFNKPVFTVLTKDPEFVNSWIHQIVNSSKRFPPKRHRLVVGLDIELVDPGPRPATVQLCIGGRCLIYHMQSTSPSLPSALEQFFLDPDNIFVGVALEYKLSVLKYKCNCAGVVPYANLGHLAACHCNRPELLGAGIGELAWNVLGKELVVPKVDRDWDWDRAELLNGQVMYACVGAYVSYEIGRATVLIM